ncbi:MAG: GxxExxY protein [Anaerolineae bacterium]|nr:GxxExxY protein [Anaerolineae bacterium]
MLHEELTGKILKAFFDVYNILGCGFLEKVYENALKIKLESLGLFVEQQKPIKVYFQGQCVGEYFADLLVNGLVILELKAAEHISPTHVSQLLHYLKATDVEVGLLLNFGLEPEFKRLLFTNDRK